MKFLLPLRIILPGGSINKNNVKYYKIYNSTDRKLENIFKNKFIGKYEKEIMKYLKQL